METIWTNWIHRNLSSHSKRKGADGLATGNRPIFYKDKLFTATRFMSAFKRGIPAEVRMDIHKEGGVFVLDSIFAPEQGNGHGTKAMKWLCGLADKHGVILMGWAEPNSGSKMPMEVLFDWYRGFGFYVLPYHDRFCVGRRRVYVNIIRIPQI